MKYYLKNLITCYTTTIEEFRDVEVKTKLMINKIEIDDESLDSIHEDVFINCINLKYFDCSKNNLICIPETIFTNCPYLSYFKCSNNKLTYLPEELYNLENLEMLICSRNKIENMNKIYKLTKLKHLDCSFNNLKDIPITRQMTQLYILCCHHNPINKMPYDIVFMKNLQNYRHTHTYTHIPELPYVVNKIIEKEFYRVHLKYYLYTYILKWNTRRVLYY